MYRNIRRAMAVVMGMALTAAMGFSASAQDDELDIAQEEPAAAEDYASDDGKGCCDTCCCGGNFYGEFQFVYLDQYDAFGIFAGEGVDSTEGYRLVGGYQGCDGLGLRARYFDFDGVENTGGTDLTGLDLQYFDVEVTDTICICNLHGLVSAGYRHAEVEAFFDDNDPFFDFEGDGVTLGLQLERDITCSLGLFGWAQHSMLYGDNDAFNADNTLLMWTEVQLGAQYATCIGGYNAVVRGGVEAQHHESPVVGFGDTGLFGYFVSAGVSF